MWLCRRNVLVLRKTNAEVTTTLKWKIKFGVCVCARVSVCACPCIQRERKPKWKNVKIKFAIYLVKYKRYLSAKISKRKAMQAFIF